MNVDLNEIIISGTINNIMDNNQDYIKFGLTTLKYDKRKVYSSLNNNIKLFITVLDIADNEEELINGRKDPHIRVDPDGVEVWNGKREEITPPTEEELEEMENLLKDFK